MRLAGVHRARLPVGGRPDGADHATRAMAQSGGAAAARHTNPRSGDRALFAAQPLGRSRAAGSGCRGGRAGRGRKLQAATGHDGHGREPGLVTARRRPTGSTKSARSSRSRSNSAGAARGAGRWPSARSRWPKRGWLTSCSGGCSTCAAASRSRAGARQPGDRPREPGGFRRAGAPEHRPGEGGGRLGGRADARPGWRRSSLTPPSPRPHWPTSRRRSVCWNCSAKAITRSPTALDLRSPLDFCSGRARSPAVARGGAATPP